MLDISAIKTMYRYGTERNQNSELNSELRTQNPEPRIYST